MLNPPPQFVVVLHGLILVFYHLAVLPLISLRPLLHRVYLPHYQHPSVV